jgi:antitoxin ParD1/3/4
MPSPEKRMFSLPTEQADYIDAMIASGRYATAADVVRAGLSALQEQESTVDTWLHEKVAPVFDAMQSDPRRAIPSDTVFGKIRAHHAARLNGRASSISNGGWR